MCIGFVAGAIQVFGAPLYGCLPFVRSQTRVWSPQLPGLFSACASKLLQSQENSCQLLTRQLRRSFNNLSSVQNLGDKFSFPDRWLRYRALSPHRPEEGSHQQISLSSN